MDIIFHNLKYLCIISMIFNYFLVLRLFDFFLWENR